MHNVPHQFLFAYTQHYYFSPFPYGLFNKNCSPHCGKTWFLVQTWIREKNCLNIEFEFFYVQNGIKIDFFKGTIFFKYVFEFSRPKYFNILVLNWIFAPKIVWFELICNLDTWIFAPKMKWFDLLCNLIIWIFAPKVVPF